MDKVRFPQVPAGTWFCVRDNITHDIAVIQVLDKDDGDWSTTIAVTAYRPTGAGMSRTTGTRGSHTWRVRYRPPSQGTGQTLPVRGHPSP